MTITITFRGLLKRHLPPGPGRAKRPIEIADGATIRAVLGQLQVPSELTHLVLLNGVQVPIARLDETTLNDRDDLAVWPPLSGG